MQGLSAGPAALALLRPGRPGARLDDHHPDLGAVGGLVGDLRGGHPRGGDRAGRLRPGRQLPGGRVVAEHDRRRGVVGVAEPRLVAALRPLGDPAGRSDPRQLEPAQPLAGGQVVHRHLAHRVPHAGDDQHRPGQVVEDRVAAQHRGGVLGEQVAPAVRPRRGRVGDAEPPARRLQVGEHVEPAVPADPGRGLRVEPDHERDKHRGRGVAGGQVGDPDVLPRRGPDRGRDDQPAAVHADAGPVVGRLVAARAEHLHVRLRRRPHLVQVHPPVVLRLALGDRVRRQPPHVVERLAARQPGDPGVPAPVDRPVHQLPGRDVEHPQQRLLVPAVRELVREQPPLLVGLTGVERRTPGGVDRDEVDQRPLGRTRGRPRPHRRPCRKRHPRRAIVSRRPRPRPRRREPRAPGPGRAGCRTASSRATRAGRPTRPGAAPAPGRRSPPGPAGHPGSPSQSDSSAASHSAVCGEPASSSQR